MTSNDTERVIHSDDADIKPPDDRDRTASPRDMFIVWGGVNVAVTNLAVGALGITLGLSLMDCFLVFLIGGALGSLAVAAGVLQGKQTGAPVMVNARPSFGLRGSKMLAVLLFLMSAGWFGVNSFFGMTAARGIAHQLGLPEGWLTSAILLVVIIAAQLLIAIYGFDVIRRFERVALIGMSLSLVLLIAFAANGHIVWDAPATVTGIDRFGMIALLTTALGAGWALSWAPWAHDMGRYVARAQSGRATFWWAWAGMWLVSLLTFMIAAAIATTADSHFDVGHTVSAVMPGALAVTVLLVMTLGLISANVVPLFSGGLALISAGIRIDRRLGTCLTAAVGLVIPVVGLFQESFGETFHSWMLGLLTWIAPWFAITMVDYFVLHKGQYTTRDLYPDSENTWQTGTPGVVAWVAGFLVSWPFANTPIYAGPLMTDHFGGADFSFWIGAAVAVGIYYPWRKRLLRSAAV